LKDEALDRTLLKTRFGLGYGPVVRKKYRMVLQKSQKFGRLNITRTVVFTFMGYGPAHNNGRGTLQ